MIPAGFDYHAPTTVEEALQLLSSSGDDVKILAGGQSLIPVLRLRLAAPEVMIDLGRIPSSAASATDGDALVIGAMAPHSEVATSPRARSTRECWRGRGDRGRPQVRHRGTFGGALAHADPAGDLPAPALALDAEMVIAGPGGAPYRPRHRLLRGALRHAIGRTRSLAQVRVPKHTGWGGHYEKFTRVAQQWSIVRRGRAVRSEGGSIAEARSGPDQHGAVPIRAPRRRAGPAGATRQRAGGCERRARPQRRGTTPRPTSTVTPTTAATSPGS
jgi:carbon-monoxide dehydrogenase medium subunit